MKLILSVLCVIIIFIHKFGLHFLRATKGKKTKLGVWNILAITFGFTVFTEYIFYISLSYLLNTIK